MAQIRENITLPTNGKWRPGDITALVAYLEAIKAGLNNVDDQNVTINAGIQMRKTDKGSLLDSHSYMHHVTYDDALEEASVSGAMVAMNSIGPWHIGVGAVTRAHFGSDLSIKGAIYVDAYPLSGSNGSVVEKPEGYENMVLLPAGYEMASSANDSSMNKFDMKLERTGDSWVLRAVVTREDHNETCNGTVYFYRFAYN